MLQKQRQQLLRILVIFFVLIGIIILRLFYLQISRGSTYFKLGERNFLRIEVIDSPRGNVIDCKGNLLATNRPVFDLWWEGTKRRSFSAEQRTVLDRLATILHSDDVEELQRLLLRSERQGKRVKIKADMSFAELCRVSEQCINASNLVIVEQFQRFYPHKSLASHVLGYVGRSGHYQIVGLSGLEKIVQGVLSGQQGQVVHVTNASGRKLMQKEYTEAKAGEDIVLTLDFSMQQLAEKVFEKDVAGAFIILDPQTGGIKVLASYPNFDPNLFLEPISQRKWSEEFTRNNPFLNRVSSGLYPPASIFKLVTFTAGLEERIIDFTTYFTCKGYVSFCGRDYYCRRRHGKVSCKKAVAHSCNSACFEIAKKISIDQLACYAYRFGLGRQTDFLLPERAGLVPSSMWKTAVKGEQWWKGETLSACIGQSYLLVTPLQVACMIGAVCTGYLVKPRILVHNPIKKESLKIADETRSFLQEAMKESVGSGTSWRLRYLKNFTIYAKTGTAQISSIRQASVRDKRCWEHGWVASFFSYKNEQPLVLVVLVEHAGGSGPALRIAQRFLVAYARAKRAR